MNILGAFIMVSLSLSLAKVKETMNKETEKTKQWKTKLNETDTFHQAKNFLYEKNYGNC